MKNNRSKKKQSKKTFSEDRRLNDAVKWLTRCPQKDLIAAYEKRYAVDAVTAETELMQIGYDDEVSIQYYEKEGIEWEYRVVPTTGDMVVVPKGVEEYEIYNIHGMF